MTSTWTRCSSAAWARALAATCSARVQCAACGRRGRLVGCRLHACCPLAAASMAAQTAGAAAATTAAAAPQSGSRGEAWGGVRRAVCGVRARYCSGASAACWRRAQRAARCSVSTVGAGHSWAGTGVRAVWRPGAMCEAGARSAGSPGVAAQSERAAQRSNSRGLMQRAAHLTPASLPLLPPPFSAPVGRARAGAPRPRGCLSAASRGGAHWRAGPQGA